MSNKMSQKEAVFSAITSVLAENNVSFTEGSNAGSLMTTELRRQVNQVLFESFRSGAVELGESHTDSELKNYISGLQSNWLRKDKRLNGGGKYSAKNPGSRIGSTDPQLKAMRALISTLSSEEDKAEVQSAIDSRVSQIQASKVRTVSIDTSSLPAELLFLVK